MVQTIFYSHIRVKWESATPWLLKPISAVHYASLDYLFLESESSVTPQPKPAGMQIYAYRIEKKSCTCFPDACSCSPVTVTGWNPSRDIDQKSQSIMPVTTGRIVRYRCFRWNYVTWQKSHIPVYPNSRGSYAASSSTPNQHRKPLSGLMAGLKCINRVRVQSD